MKRKTRKAMKGLKNLRKAVKYLEGDFVQTTWTEEEINGGRMLLLKLYRHKTYRP